MAESHGEPKGATAHTEADGGHKAPFPPFQKDTFASQLVSLVIAFVALYLIVSKIALPRVGGVIDERQNTIDGDLTAAQKLKDESDGALKAYESELAAARSRARAIGAETRENLRLDARGGDEQCAGHRNRCGRRHRPTADRSGAGRHVGRTGR